MRGGKGSASGGSGPLAIPAAHAMQQMLAALFGRPRLVLVMLRAMWWEGGREGGWPPLATPMTLGSANSHLGRKIHIR